MTELDLAERTSTARHLMLQGVVLLILAFVCGLTIGLAANPRTVLAAHVIGITTGLTAIAVAVCQQHAHLSPFARRVMVWTLLPSLYLGFLTQWLAGFVPLSRMFIVTAAGDPEGAAWLETVVEIIVKGISPLTILPFIILAVGRHRAAAGFAGTADRSDTGRIRHFDT